ncbi:SPOR domain-containing protein [Chryseobacterium oryzae]|uniref:SPOR domain-containing protein n=1 Tax=Chryseobacterium oryzae TaxID=2929799 RepID=A0ABY4BHS0_9FLAO|nr:SPOR domain-containing protein [Chryseobacterium oryzae]UOE38294.1 SPOR domain-containing protein [Chryseobacterium oryzae]
MKNLIKIFAFLSFTGFYTVDAQQVVKKDTLSGTALTLTMDTKVNDAISALENKCNNSTVSKTSDEETFTKPAKVFVPSRELTNAEICRRNPRILGYKIQITTVKSNDEANEIKTYFRKRFPNIKVETDASLRPNYKILAGSYFNKQSASGDLAKIKEYFKSATAVQYRVFCAEAK